jgi:dimethylamine monooxygenase subunit A
MLPDWLNLDSLFASGDYRFSMGLKRIGRAEFFGNLETEVTSSGVDLLKTRTALLVENPGDYVCEPIDQAEAATVVDFASRWVAVSRSASLRDLGMRWEPDFVLLHRAPDPSPIREPGSRMCHSPVVIGGCVCFPSGWSLPEKYQKPLLLVHGPVPGLNEELGPQIDRMLSSIRPDDCYQRMNWGLSSSEMLSQHPNRPVQRISSEFDPATTYVRIEWQALTALDDLRLLFGIRIHHFSLEEARLNDQLAGAMSIHLKTMPEGMAKYKRIEQCRDRLINYLLQD